MAEKDPKKITLKEAAELYSQQIGTSKITAFGSKGKLKEYGNIPLVDIYKGNIGERVLDKMLQTADTAGKYNTLTDNLRLATIPVRRLLTQSNPTDPILGKMPDTEAGSELTKTVFGERKVAEEGAKIAILTNNKSGWKEFFDKIDAIADDPNNPKQALANAFRVSYYTGPRPGLIAGLQGSEYLIDQGAIYVTPQTKQVGAAQDQETRKGASKGKTSFKGKATPYTVPLGENAHAYLQQQLKMNANDPDIKAYLAEQNKQGKAPIFVQKTVGKDGKVKVSAIDTTAISNMLSDITTSTPIIVDNVSGQEYKSLNPKGLKKEQGKFGSALSRNIHGSIAINQLDFDNKLIDFLHGRSETSGTVGRGQTQKLGYAIRPRGEFTQGERDGQQLIGNWINEVQGKSAIEIPDVQTTVSKANYAIEGFFDAPKTEVTGTPAIDKKSDVVAKILSGEISIADQMAAWRAKKKGGTPSGGGKTGAAIIGGLGVGSALMAGDAEAGLETGSQMIAEEALEKGTIELLKKAGMAARSANPIGAGLTIAGSTVSTVGDQAFDKENRVAQQLGISRADLIKLPEEEKNKLYSLLGEYKREQLAGEQEKISLGEQMRSLSSDSATRPLDSGKIETDSIMDQMISSGQI
jgi:integrase